VTRENAEPLLSALIVAADAGKRRTLVDLVAGRGARAREAENGTRAWELLGAEPFDLVVAIGEVSSGDGKSFVAAVRELDETTAVVAVVDSAERGREALSEGAYDVFTRPLDRDRFLVVIGRIHEAIALRARCGVLEQMLNGGTRLGGLFTCDPHMIHVVDGVRRWARYRAPILIVGEPGTEHEEVARALHDLGRPDGPFVASSAALTVAELRAKHAEAAGGTVFIDDVAGLAADVGTALSVLLEEGTAESARPRFVVSYPYADPPTIEPADPRSQLYRHLTENLLRLPPLRERRGDAVLVARELVAGIGRDRGRELAIGRAVEDALRAYTWPGNLDELKTVVAIAATAANGPTVELYDLPAPIASLAGAVPEPPTRRLRDLEIQHLRQVIEETGGNKSRAARILGLTRWALQRKLRKHGITLEGSARDEPDSEDS